MNPIIKKLVSAMTLALVATATQAAASVDSDRIVRNVAPLLRGLVVEKVMVSAHAGLYEILTPAGLFYTDRTGSFVIFGATVVDTKTKANLTEQRLNEFSKFEFSELPFKDAIKSVKGDGSRAVVTFEDPNCGYCKRLIQEVNKLENVTVYTFLVPILSPDSAAKSKAIWCAKDQVRSWNDYMVNNIAPTPAAASCETPLDRNLALSKKLRINGTPALLFKNNTKIAGYVKAEQLEAALRK